MAGPPPKRSYYVLISKKVKWEKRIRDEGE
jgi:hypothetical protein